MPQGEGDERFDEVKEEILESELYNINMVEKGGYVDFMFRKQGSKFDYPSPRMGHFK